MGWVRFAPGHSWVWVGFGWCVVSQFWLDGLAAVGGQLASGYGLRDVVGPGSGLGLGYVCVGPELGLGSVGRCVIPGVLLGWSVPVARQLGPGMRQGWAQAGSGLAPIGFVRDPPGFLGLGWFL